jgi:outer membrane protein OmpA-like peptidoglycan-associated protein
VARRTAQRAEALGNTVTAQAVRDHADRTYAVFGPIDGQQHEAMSREEALEHERVALRAADVAARALASLARSERATVQPRGLVINLPGLLFESGGTSLLGNAEYELRLLAQDLRATGRAILVEGHTDSVGGADFNRDLSLRRARAVRDYLIEQGAPAAAIRAVGNGPDNPVADNATPSGRALNRRVEIIVSR